MLSPRKPVCRRPASQLLEREALLRGGTFLRAPFSSILVGLLRAAPASIGAHIRHATCASLKTRNRPKGSRCDPGGGSTAPRQSRYCAALGRGPLAREARQLADIERDWPAGAVRKLPKMRESRHLGRARHVIAGGNPSPAPFQGAGPRHSSVACGRNASSHGQMHCCVREIALA